MNIDVHMLPLTVTPGTTVVPTTTTVPALLPAPNVCPGCGRCKDCGQPYAAPAPPPPFVWPPSPLPWPGYEIICGTTSGSVSVSSEGIRVWS